MLGTHTLSPFSAAKHFRADLQQFCSSTYRWVRLLTRTTTNQSRKVLFALEKEIKA